MRDPENVRVEEWREGDRWIDAMKVSERVRERERQTHTHTHTHTTQGDRDRERGTDRHHERDTGRKRNRDRKMKRDRKRQATEAVDLESRRKKMALDMEKNISTHKKLFHLLAKLPISFDILQVSILIYLLEKMPHLITFVASYFSVSFPVVFNWLSQLKFS